VPSNFLQLAVVFRCALREASPELLAKYEERRNEKQEREWGNMGGAITRDGEGKEEKRKRIGIHPT